MIQEFDRRIASAEKRRCPECNRKSAMRFEKPTDEMRTCRWCGYKNTKE